MVPDPLGILSGLPHRELSCGDELSSLWLLCRALAEQLLRPGLEVARVGCVVAHKVALEQVVFKSVSWLGFEWNKGGSGPTKEVVRLAIHHHVR